MKIKRKLKRKKNVRHCKCGCGQEVKIGNKYILGHNRYRKKLSDETRKKIGLANKGKILSDETKLKMSLTQTGKILLDETRKKIGLANKGKIRTKEHKRKMSLAARNMSKESRKKISISLIKCRTDGYCDAWSDNEYKKDCRKNYCENCGVKEKIKIVVFRKNYKRGQSNLNLHHIDLDKKNCCSDNLQTLCRSCHMKLHHLVD